ncbi:MAG TPA: FtsX-like permease family protein [Caulobacteraceae bacterium]|nr:FtsX-like permease family protein [Caulobacteraceae bacterium]
MAWRNLWRNRGRTAITLIVVAAGVYSILCLTALVEAWAQSSRQATLDWVIGSAQIHAPGFMDDPKLARRMAAPGPALRAALASPGVAGWSSRLRVPAAAQSEYRLLPVTLIGVDPAAEARVSIIARRIERGRFLGGPQSEGVVIGAHLAQRLKTDVGRRIILMSPDASGRLAERSFDVVGLFAGNLAAEDADVFTGIATTRAMLGAPGAVTEIALAVPNESRLPAVLAAVRSAAPALDVRSWRKLSPMADAIDSFMQAFVDIWLWIMFVLVGIGVVNTQLTAVRERTREFGLLQALGMRPRLIVAEVAMESALLIGLGVAIGMAASGLTIGALHAGVDLGGLARGAAFWGAGRVLHPSLAASQFVELALIVWALGVLVALWPAWRAARVSPVEVISHAT